MAGKLTCEVCGGGLVAAGDGMFECEFCGTKYSKDWMQQKIQEIKGTVKVEGTVQVEGTVKLDGPVEVKGGATKESLAKRGKIALEDADWDSAKSCFEEALRIDPEYGDAYAGLLCVSQRYSQLKDIANDPGWGEDGGITEQNQNAVQRIIDLMQQEKSLDAIREIRTIKGCDLKDAKELLAHMDVQQGFRNIARVLGLVGITAEAKLHYDKILRYGSADLKQEIDGYIRTAKDALARYEEDTQAQIKEAVHRLLPIRNRLSGLQGLVAAGRLTVALRVDGAVVAVGDNKYGQCEVSDWEDIVAVSAGSYIVGLRSSGTVVTTGKYDVFRWMDIVAVSAGDDHTVGLKSDGTVVAVGNNKFGQCDVSGWTDVVAISAGNRHTVGLKADGTVVATKYTGEKAFNFGQCEVSGWRDIVAVSAGGFHTVGLKSDGTVVTTGRDDVSGWRDIVAVSAGGYHTVGLKSDGTVVAVRLNLNLTVLSPVAKDCGQCDVSGWTDIVAVSAGNFHTMGLKSDGSIVAVGSNDYDRCNVSDWKLFSSVDTVQEELEAAQKAAEEARIAREKAAEEECIAREKAEEAERIAEEARQLAIARKNAAIAEKRCAIAAWQVERSKLGFFDGKRKKEIDAQIAALEAQIRSM